MLYYLNSSAYPVASGSKLPKIRFLWVELLRVKFKRSTQKLSFRLTDFDLDLKVNIED